jgi:parallel beta-helix repeat protein
MVRFAFLIFVAALCAVLTLVPASFAKKAATPAAQPTCGAIIVADTTLSGDLNNCPGDGIVIGADDVTLNLDRHTIDGDAIPGAEALDVGIRNEGHDGVTIEGGTVQEFDRGVGLLGASENLLRQLTVTGSSGRGITLEEGSNGNRIENNTSADNRNRGGIVVVSSDGNLIERNTLSGNHVGVGLLDGSTGNRVEDNSLADNPQWGFQIDLSDRNAVIHNRIVRSGDGIILVGSSNTIIGNLVADAVGCENGECGGFGISVEGGSDNLVAGNTVTRTLGNGVRLDAYVLPAIGNVFRGNLVRTAGVDGIAIDRDQVGPVLDTLLDSNIAIGAGDDGIDIESPATTLTRNLTVHNADLGIEAVPGVTDGGGNHAAGNGNPAQCTNVAC